MKIETEKQRKKRKKPKAQLAILLSYECLDKLDFLCDSYHKSRSKMIEVCINTIYESYVEEFKKRTKKKAREKLKGEVEE